MKMKIIINFTSQEVLSSLDGQNCDYDMKKIIEFECFMLSISLITLPDNY